MLMTPSRTIENPSSGPRGFGISAAGLGDRNGDGFCDLIIGAPHGLMASPQGGSAFVLDGSPLGLVGGPQQTLVNPLGPPEGSYFGRAVGN
jgi:hypothetical protein